MATHRDRTFATALFMLIGASTATVAETPQQRGEVLARGMCSACHAIGKTGNSKHPAAPRFRRLDDQTNLAKLSRRLQGGLLTGHEGMPLFRFSGDDADAMVAYIRSIQGP
jgi:mono/diheme cytochrome c family protein